MRTKKIMNLVCLFSFLLCSAGVFAQGTVTGTVTDDNNLPILGATVQVQGTSTGVVTDDNGNYSIQASDGDVLIVSYIGFGRKQVTVSGTTVNVQLQEDVSLLNEVVVSSTRKPVRKLQTTTSVNTVGIAELETIKPESFSEALQNTPGVTIDESQGRKGGFNIRGFPGGNFVTTLIDGMPVSGIANQSGGTQEFFGLDPNVERIEVVRGAAATLFGRSSAAGALNIISKTGGTETKGSFSITKYNNTANDGHIYDGDLDYRADFNLNGPLSDKLRYNIGGYVIQDSGVKEQANKDKGFQLRANVDWLISDKSRIRFYTGYFNNQFQNIIGTVWDMQNESLAEGWNARSTFYNNPLGSMVLNQNLGVRQAFFNTAPVTNAAGGGALTWNPAESIERAKGINFGADATFHLGNEWYFSEKIRYNDFFLRDINDLNLTTIFEQADTTTRLNANALNQNRELLTETRISKQIQGDSSEHNLTFGLYYSDAKRDRLGFNYFYGSNVSPRPTFTTLFGFGNGSFSDPTLPQTVYISNTSSHREETATGIFLGDEMVFNEKLSINAGFRYDWQKGYINNNPEEIRENSIDFDPGTEEENEIKLTDYSFSIGANYLTGETSAVYANFTRSFTFQTVDEVDDEFLDNELVKNFEIGYRAGLGDLTLDATYFNTNIDNSVSTIFDNDVGGFVDRPAGSYKINGAEIALAYTPKMVKGLLLSGSFTLQNSEFDDFIEGIDDATVTAINDAGNPLDLNLVNQGGATALDLSGNQVRQQPKTIFNLNLAYNGKNWGANFGGFTYTGLYYDNANIYNDQSLSVYNTGAYVKFPLGDDEIRLSLLVKNVFDGTNAQNIFTGGGLDEVIQSTIADPNYTNQLAFAVTQNPKRVLFTVGYSF
ncbi:MAG: TonB-dependent receptor [Maribacter sp.]|uniref:TonB-dependent receptor n=1 Tax=Maribacter sp. TaxID=1897614 RepID=UPI003299339B